MCSMLLLMKPCRVMLDLDYSPRLLIVCICVFREYSSELCLMAYNVNNTTCRISNCTYVHWKFRDSKRHIISLPKYVELREQKYTGALYGHSYIIKLGKSLTRITVRSREGVASWDKSLLTISSYHPEPVFIWVIQNCHLLAFPNSQVVLLSRPVAVKEGAYLPWGLGEGDECIVNYSNVLWRRGDYVEVRDGFLVRGSSALINFTV